MNHSESSSMISSIIYSYLSGWKKRILTLLVLFIFAAASASAKNMETNVRDAQAALDGWQMDELPKKILDIPAGAERSYFEGVLANRRNNVELSESLLSSAFPELRRTRPKLAAQALLVLSDNYRKDFQYAKQLTVIDELTTQKYRKYLNQQERNGLRTEKAMAIALERTLPQKLSSSKAIAVLPIISNPIGTLNIQIAANGVEAPWMLDSGANFSIVSESYAKRMGVQVIGTIPGVRGSTGSSVSTKIGVIKEIKLGPISITNVVVLISEDAALLVKLPEATYQIDAALGYPVFEALGKIRFSKNGELTAAPGEAALETGVPMFMDELTPVLQLVVNGRSLPFRLDTGASSSDLWKPYLVHFPNRIRQMRKDTIASSGLGGSKKFDVLIEPKLTIDVDHRTVVLKDVPVRKNPLDDTGKEAFVGTIGQDLWHDADDFTIDFRSMRFDLHDED